MTTGFRILKRDRVAAPELVAEFAKLPVANVSDSMSRMTAAGSRLRPMHTSGGMAGVALTVKARPGDNLMLHAAIDRAVPAITWIAASMSRAFRSAIFVSAISLSSPI